MNAFLTLGGPMLKISVNKKLIEFEMHPYCGPNILSKRTGEPLSKQPLDFLEAASHWHQQGKRMENGLCRWDHPPKEITKHIGGRNYMVVGMTEPVKGE